MVMRIQTITEIAARTAQAWLLDDFKTRSADAPGGPASNGVNSRPSVGLARVDLADLN